ncbi:putative Protein YIPF1 [Hibiscus syriacus]|uniref:Uncharacterized protein n=1 Tax=Hibiscus syriacus TaxID=106335 RepID=A0A6A2WYF6_HIBSY|nr:putative Protein YIPF1 [Hibiscus syriacus]
MVSKGLLAGSLLLMFLSISALNHGVLGARFLKVEDEEETTTAQRSWKNQQSVDNGTDGFFATINREVPSCPDPLHNK